MNAITFDTLQYAQSLEAEGVEKKHAEAHAEALKNVLNNVEQTGIATKNDLLELKISVKNDLFDMKISLIKWMVTLLITTQTVFVGIIFTLLKFFST